MKVNVGTMFTVPEFMRSRAMQTLHIKDLIEEIYPDLQNHIGKQGCPRRVHLENGEWLLQRAILTPLNKDVDKLNNSIIESLAASNTVTSTSIDSASDLQSGSDAKTDYPEEFLNSLEISGLPPHSLKLAPGMIIILMRTIDRYNGHYNGCRYIIESVTTRLIVAIILQGPKKGDVVFIPTCPKPINE